MATHYNAFISYNHNPRDMKIAALLQQKLEHFHVPMRIKTDGPPPQIKRVFLDKGELGVAMDLNDEIQTALQNSDYLIVICSPESNASIWVHREIGFFLQNHSVDKILTVITAGEPNEVLPEEILSKEVVDEDGMVRKVMREPLSCDYRLPVKRANKIELPRLVAAILGVRYDDLMQRQRHYRMVRLAAIGGTAFVLMLVAIGYLIWSNNRIQENYENSLREQSRSLALQSEQALNDGDRPLAIEYALQALPSKDMDRPIVTEAVHALVSAEGVYQTPDNSWLTSVRSYYDFEVIDYLTNENSEVTYLLGFNNDRLAVMDTATGVDLCEAYGKELLEGGESVSMLAAYDQTRFLLMVGNELRMYDLEAGAELWAADLSEFGDPISDAFIYKDGIWVCTRTYDFDENYNTISTLTMVEVDAASGRLLQHVDASDYYSYNDTWVQSADGRLIAFAMSYYADEAISEEDQALKKDMITVFDVETGQSSSWETNAFITDLAFDGSDALIVSQIGARPSMSDYSSYGTGIYEFNLRNRRKYFVLSGRRDIHLTALSVPGFAVKWERDYHEMCNGVPTLDVRTDLAEDEPAIYCTAGNILHILDSSGGEAATVYFASPVMAYNYNGKSGVAAVLHSGQFASYNMQTGDLSQSQFFASPVMDAVAQNGTFYIDCPYGENFSKYKTLQYTTEPGDPAWQVYSEADGSLNVYSFGETFIEVPSYLNDGDRIVERDVRSGDEVWDFTIAYENDTLMDNYVFDALDESTGELVLVGRTHSDYSGERVRYLLNYTVIDAATGEPRLGEAWIDSPWEDYGDIETVTVENGFIYLLAGSYEAGEPMYLVQVATADGSTVVSELQDYIGEDSVLDYSTNRRLRVKDGTMLVAADDTVLVYGVDGSPVCQTAETGGSLLEFTMFEGKVLALMSEGDAVHCVLFSASDGTLQEDHVIHGMEVPDSSWQSEFDVVRLSEDEILIRFFGAAYLVRSGDWDLLADINGFRAYSPATGEFYLTGEENGHVPYRTLEELIALGHELLGTN